MDGWIIFGRVADCLTVAAALIALFGVLSAWLSRPRLMVSFQYDGGSSATFYVFHKTGAQPARNLFLGWGALDQNGTAVFGDGSSPWESVLLSGDSRSATFYDPLQHFFGSPPHDREIRREVGGMYGLVVDVTWQHPL